MSQSEYLTTFWNSDTRQLCTLSNLLHRRNCLQHSMKKLLSHFVAFYVSYRSKNWCLPFWPRGQDGHTFEVFLCRSGLCRNVVDSYCIVLALSTKRYKPLGFIYLQSWVAFDGYLPLRTAVVRIVLHQYGFITILCVHSCTSATFWAFKDRLITINTSKRLWGVPTYLCGFFLIDFNQH